MLSSGMTREISPITGKENSLGWEKWDKNCIFHLYCEMCHKIVRFSFLKAHIFIQI